MQYTFNIEKLSSDKELSADDLALLSRARQATKLAYAPYSNFFVGSAALLTNGEIIVGSNQENVSYGATVCAERVLLASLSTIYPKETIQTIAVSSLMHKSNNDKPVSPCGICRQVLLEHEKVAKHKIRIIMGGQEGEVWIVESASSLLPLAFTDDDLNLK